MNQCCQGAEILATERKWGCLNSARPGKRPTEFLADLPKKARKGAELCGVLFIT
jgi:hypothetical protein